MVLGYHVIFGTYGFWLPNDPRGSWSRFVGCWELACFGKATKVSTARSLAREPHDQQLRRRAKEVLKYPTVHFSGRQALAVAHGFAQARQEGEYVVRACSILPEHVHMVIARHTRPIGRIVGHFKARATQRLSAEGMWIEKDRPVWAKKSGWCVFLDTPEQLARAIQYVADNPSKEGKPKQRWSFVAPPDEHGI